MPPNPIPPVAPRSPVITEVHGERRSDDYHWLRDKGSRPVNTYLKAENAYTAAMMAPSLRLQKRLYREMLARIKETDVEVPYREGDHFYYSRTRKGSQYRIYCRRHGGVKAPEQIVLDVNQAAKGHKFYSLGAFEVSPDGNLLAFSSDTTGFRQYTLQVKDLRDGRILPDRIEKARSIAWASDNRTFFYAQEDEAKRAYRIYRHVLGAAEDQLIYEETDARFSVSVSRSRSNEYLFLTSHSATTSEVRSLRADEPQGNPALILPRKPEHEYYVDHGHGLFYIVTNDKGRNFRLVTAPAADPSPPNWTELIAQRDDVMLDGVEVFARHVVAHERTGGFPRLRVIRLADQVEHVIEMPEPVYSVGGGANMEFDTDVFRFHYDSYVTPDSEYDYHLDTRERTLLKQREVKRYDPSKYRSELHSWDLVRRDGEPVGFISCSFGADKGCVKLNKLYLLPALHGQGLGRQMLEHVCTRAERQGAREVRLQVNKQNTRAIRAYGRAGFQVREAVVADIGGGFVMDDYVMTREV